jgi:hypothetical protein
MPPGLRADGLVSFGLHRYCNTWESIVHALQAGKQATVTLTNRLGKGRQ